MTRRAGGAVARSVHRGDGDTWSSSTASVQYQTLYNDINGYIDRLTAAIDAAAASWIVWTPVNLSATVLQSPIPTDLDAFLKAANYTPGMPTGSAIDWKSIFIEAIKDLQSDRSSEATAAEKKLDGFKLPKWDDARKQ